MKTRQEKINAIYEKIADKTLSFGCKCWINEPDMPGKMTHIGTIKKETLFSKKYIEVFWCETESKIMHEKYKIIGHPIMLGDIIDFTLLKELGKKYIYVGISEEETYKLINEKYKNEVIKILRFWKQLRKPIEAQSDECVDFVFDLIFK